MSSPRVVFPPLRSQSPSPLLYTNKPRGCTRSHVSFLHDRHDCNARVVLYHEMLNADPGVDGHAAIISASAYGGCIAVGAKSQVRL